MFVDLGTVLIFILVAIAFVVVNVSVVSALLRPTKPEGAKHTTYECGEPPIGTSWVRFDMRFYSVALDFLIFDVEVAVLYPWAVVYTQLLGKQPFADGTWLVYAEGLIFIGLLALGLAYLWVKGDLSWNKDIESQDVEDKLFGFQKKRKNLAGAES